MLVVNVATPLASRATGACGTLSIENVTVPVGVPLPLVGVTVAVKVTDCPKTDGLEALVKVVVVGNV